MSGRLIAQGDTDGVEERVYIDPEGMVPGHVALTIFDGHFATIDLTSDQARAVAAHLTDWADRMEES